MNNDIKTLEMDNTEYEKVNYNLEQILAWKFSILILLFLFYGHLRVSIFTAIPPIIFIVLVFFKLPFVKDFIWDNRFGWALFSGALFLGTLLSQLPIQSIKGVYDFFRGALVLIPTIWLVRHHKSKLLSVFPWVALPSSLLVIGVLVSAQAQGGPAKTRAVLDQLFNQYNVFGHGVGVLYVCSLCFGLFQWKRDRLVGLGWLLLVVALLGTVVLSGSRGSLVACILVSILILAFDRPKWTLLFLGAGLMLVGGAFYLFKLGVAGEFGMWNRGGDLTAGRLDIYGAAIEAWWEKGRWFGFGPNTFKYLEYGHTRTGPIPMPHNVLLELLGSLGLVGSLTFLAGFWFFLRRIPWCRVGKDLVGLIGVSLICYMLVRGMFDLKLWGAYYPGVIMLGVGFAISFDNLVEQQGR